MESPEPHFTYPCKVLVTGGCGYIGSHAVWRLLADGAQAVVIDTLENGKQSAICPDLAQALIDSSRVCIAHASASGLLR